MSTDFEVEGLDNLLMKLQNMGKEGSIIQDESLTKAVQPILEDEKNTTLFKDESGKLRKSLKVSKVKNVKGGKSIWIGDTDRKAMHGWYLQYGSTKSKPFKARPFITEAYDKNKDKIYQNLKEAIQKNLQK